MAEALEQTLHEFVSARVSLLGIADKRKRVGEITSSATRYRHLGKHLRVLFEYGYVGIRIATLSFYGCKIARCATTDDSNT